MALKGLLSAILPEVGSLHKQDWSLAGGDQFWYNSHAMMQVQTMRCMLIVNPSAGPVNFQPQLPAVLTYLEDHGCSATLHQTEYAGEATQLAQQARDEGLDAVFVVGGDGTINEVVNGIAGSQVALGVLPGGTGNVWARELGLPRLSPLHLQPLVDSIQALFPCSTRRIDLGRANGRYFLQWSGLGLDAAVTYAMEPRTRTQRRMGAIGYITAGLGTAANLVGQRTRIYIDGMRIYRRSILIVVSNSQLYGGITRIATDARLDDGLLDVSVFEGKGFGSIMRTFFSVLSGLHVYDPRHTSYRGRVIQVYADKPMPVHVDGDPFSTTPFECEVVPLALTVLIPQRVRSDLFA
jgi:diacylglycerol kinase (ATP)